MVSRKHQNDNLQVKLQVTNTSVVPIPYCPVGAFYVFDPFKSLNGTLLMLRMTGFTESYSAWFIHDTFKPIKRNFPWPQEKGHPEFWSDFTFGTRAWPKYDRPDSPYCSPYISPCRSPVFSENQIEPGIDTSNRVRAASIISAASSGSGTPHAFQELKKKFNLSEELQENARIQRDKDIAMVTAMLEAGTMKMPKGRSNPVPPLPTSQAGLSRQIRAPGIPMTQAPPRSQAASSREVKAQWFFEEQE
jgi:hypothetical protein